MQQMAIKRVVALTAGPLLIMQGLLAVKAQETDILTRTAQLAQSKAARVLYSSPEKAAVEAVSLVRYVYGPAEYVLLGAPALALSLAEGGPLGLGKKVTFDIVTEIIRESLQHPEKASRKIAKSVYDMGLKAYRDNYRLYGKFKKGQRFSSQEARDFLINWHVQNYMGAAKKLYNDTSAYEGKDILRKPDKLLLQQLEATAVGRAREVFGPLAALEVSALLKATKLEFTVFESVLRASIGLGAYPPYRDFLENMRKINQALVREVTAVNMTKLETPEGPPSPKKPASYGPELTHTSFVTLAEMGFVKSVEIRDDIVRGVVHEGHLEWKNYRRFWSRVPGNLQNQVIKLLTAKAVEIHTPGAPAEREADMVLVPAGGFWMGSDDEYALPRESPRRRIRLESYKIDKYEVTNGEYKRFVEATGRKAPEGWADERFNAPKQPVVGVTWEDADAYCRWAGKQLPTEAQWEKAARGTDGRRYPWGEEWDPSRANTGEGGRGKTAPVGSYPRGASPYGVHDMAGNVYEWVQDSFDHNTKVWRGGSWRVSGFNARTSHRFPGFPEVGSLQVGFRCMVPTA